MSAHAPRTRCGSLAPTPQPLAYIRGRMRDVLQALLREASDAKRSADFWNAAAGILSGWAGGARLSIRYPGINESGSGPAGAGGPAGRRPYVAWPGAPRGPGATTPPAEPPAAL